MGQSGNSNRNASLDDKKERAAGRQDSPGSDAQGAGKDFDTPHAGRGQTKGAFGSGEHTKSGHRPSDLSKGGGGGGGAASTPKD